MKKHVLWLPLILMAMFASAAVSTKAQSNGLRANVPFDFIVGDKTIPAGRISAQGMTASVAGPLSITNNDSGEHVSRIARTSLGSDDSKEFKLVFRKYGDRYYLAQVCIQGYKALDVTKSNSERALERESRLEKNSKPELVVVLAEMR